MKLFSKVAAIAAIAAILVTVVPCAYAGEVYIEEVAVEKTVVKGVTYQNIKRLDDAGWQDIHIVRADLTEPHLKFNVLRSAQGVSYLETTLESAKKNDTVAAINADFFASKRGEAGRGSPVGMEVIDGKFNSTSATAEAMNVLYQLKEDGVLYLNSFVFDITVTAPNGVSEKVSALNKYDDMNGLVMYTDAWNNLSLGAQGAVMEIVVSEDGEVIDKRFESEPVEIPKGGYILTSNLTKNTFIDDNLQIGDKVSIEITTTPNYKLIENAVGGGGIVLAEGNVPSSFSHNITGYQPRSAVGIDKSGKIITLVAVDGRRSGAKGMTQTQLGYLMADLGCYSAMNLDGGGSTALVLKEKDEQHIANTPSDGSSRKVTNSIGITSDAPVTSINKIKIKTEDDKVFKNTSRCLTIEAYDKYDHILDVGADKVTWSVIKGDGYMDKNVFRPIAAGDVTIRAKYKGFSDEINLTVLDMPHRMAFKDNKLSLNSGKNGKLTIYGWDDSGVRATIYPEDTDFVVEKAIAHLENDSIKADSKGATVVTANFGAVSATMALMVDGAEEITAPEGKRIADPQNKSAELSDNGFRFTVFGNTRTPKTLFDLFMMNKTAITMQDNGDLHVFVGSDFDADSVKLLSEDYYKADSYQKFTYKNSTFITLDNSSGSIAGSSVEQWAKLQADINAADTENIFIFLKKSAISTIDVEKRSFDKLVSAAAKKGKNVYVFGGGFKNETAMENGVRYINTAGVFPSIGLKPPANNISYVKYVLVTVNGDDVTYEYKHVLD